MKDEGARCRELLWSLRRRAHLRPRLVGDRPYFTACGPEDEWYLIPVPSRAAVVFFDLFADMIGARALSETMIERLGALITREATGVSAPHEDEEEDEVPEPVERRPEPERPRPIWDESDLPPLEAR
jgi:hypothetical protein